MPAAEIAPARNDGNAILSAVENAKKGDTVRLPEGTFEIDEPLAPASGVRILGAGRDKTILVYSGDEPAPFIYLKDCEDVEIAHLALDGRNRPIGQDGIHATNSRRLSLHHLAIRNLAKGNSPFVHGIMFTGHNPTMERGVTDCTIADCVIENVGVGAEYGGGIRMAWGSGRNVVERNVIRQTGRGGIFGDHSAELVVRNNRVTGSGGEGLGIEIWGGCPRSLIEDNVVDHWISIDRGDRSAVRRNIVRAEDDSLKFIGIEVIASDVVVTDNVIGRGASIGLSVSNDPKKNNVFWGYNTISDCAQWGAQLQGEDGGIAQHYFYRCAFEKTVRGDPRASYPESSGHGFRFNGASRQIVFEECSFRDNGACGLQLFGAGVDLMTFLRCEFRSNGRGSTTGISADRTVELRECRFPADSPGPATRAFALAAPVAEVRMPQVIRARQEAQFECASKAAGGQIVQRLWDFGHGVAEVTADPKHTYDQPGKYRLTLIVWDSAGRAGRFEKTIIVLPAP